MKTYKTLYQFITIILVLLFCFAFTEIVSASSTDDINDGILYVKPNGTGNCSSWAQACNLQTALTNAVSGDQIWVAAGTYKPTTSTDRNATFQLKSGIAVYGGFPAAGGDWSSRNWTTNVTTLSGEIGTIGSILDNSYHVVTAINVDSTTIFDGFSITGGNANGSETQREGGGMFITNSSPLLSNIYFYSNNAVYGGGAFANESNPTLVNVTFTLNTSSIGGGLCGSETDFILTNVKFLENSSNQGGALSQLGSTLTIHNGIFSDNSSSGSGGAIDAYGATNIKLYNVEFSANHTGGDGGAIYSRDSSPWIISNSTFSGNSADDRGGAIRADDSHFTISYSTFFQNTSGTANDGGAFSTSNTGQPFPIIENSILWGNSPEQLGGWDYHYGLCVTVNYSIVQNGWFGTGNLESDPNLQPLAYNGGFSKTHALLQTSPAVDSAGPNYQVGYDQRGYHRPYDGNLDGNAIRDRGAYEYGSQPELFSLTVLSQQMVSTPIAEVDGNLV